jgi:hypothetical protein
VPAILAALQQRQIEQQQIEAKLEASKPSRQRSQQALLAQLPATLAEWRRLLSAKANTPEVARRCGS